MSTISREHSDRLYWLGRYTERVFTTLLTLQRLYDKMIDNSRGYVEYLNCFGMNDYYGCNQAFIRSFLYANGNLHSVAYSLERAYDNGIVLREEISTESLSFFAACEGHTRKLRKGRKSVAFASSAERSALCILGLPLRQRV